ncbi:Rne/Rng family ribonuclease [Streptacidiphilus griseoplanus]|uniref:Rne/Rng family ribonuclease n=1 Tax=Peterkaempfera griseoplana TaxID=66896 RepID=UPI0006E1CFD1|nr:Rne/Rng family ribonuclease [Peterkaempfera griseoplana]
MLENNEPQNAAPDGPADGTVNENAHEEGAAAAPPRRRRRAVSRPAGPPQGAEAAPAAEQPVAEQPAAEAPAAEAPVEPEKPKRVRRTRKKAEVAPEPVAEEPAAVAEQAAAEAPAVEAPVEPEKPKRVRRTRKKAEVAPEPVAEEPVVEAVPAAEQPAAEAPAEPEAEAEAEEPVEEAVVEPEPPHRTRRRVVRPVTAVFQAPVFQEPAAPVAAPSRDRDDHDRDDHDEDETAAVEADQVGRRRRRRRAAVPAGPAVAEEAVAEPLAEPAEDESAAEEESREAEHGEDDGRPSRRRRRGGRRRRRGDADDRADEDHEDHEDESEEPAGEADEEDDELAAGLASSRRRRRRRRRSGDTGPELDTAGTDDPERTVVKVREPRKKAAHEPAFDPDEVQSIKGSTRLEAKKQRRREGREMGRRRVPIITEAEFLARRESVERVMVVRQSGQRTQIGVLEDGVLVEHYVNKEQATSYVGNVYLGKVQNVLPSMEAAFVDIGKGRNAVLYAGEVNFEALGHGGPRRIESVLKSGQSVLVQVTKDPIGHKGARLTSQVSLPGRYLVYVPEGSMTGISRKLPDTERTRLKQILKKIVPDDAGVIVRTAAEGASEEELTRDVLRLQSQWEELQKKVSGGNAPTLLYGEPDMTVRVVRDIFNEDFKKVIVQGDEAWGTVHEYVNHVAPDLGDRLQRWTSDVDVFATYRIDEQLMKALDRKVWLPSGGSLVIDRTEAMVVVDVNTGKFTGQGGNLEETVTRNNLEAAEEIVRQLRLRDLGGIIVIDFIDMVLESNRDLVLRRLLECLGRDRTKHQVAEVTSLGLVQMTRKRVGQGLLESFSEQCVHCNGRGVIVHMDQPSVSGGAAASGASKRRRRGKGGVAAGEPHIHEHEIEHEHEHEIEAEPEEPVEAPEPVVAEPAAVEPAAAEPAVAAVEQPAPEVEPEPAVAAVSLVELPATPAPGGRTRRRAVRKATAPAGPPVEAEAAVLVLPARAVEDGEAAAEQAVAPAAEPVAEPVAESLPAAPDGAVEAGAAEAEPEAPRKRAARKTAAKKTTTAKKTAAAKKTTTRKTATKRSVGVKKTAAPAEGESSAPVAE